MDNGWFLVMLTFHDSLHKMVDANAIDGFFSGGGRMEIARIETSSVPISSWPKVGNL